MIHLDTSFLIGSLVRGSSEDSTLRRWLSKGEPVAMSAIAWTEFLCGPVTEASIGIVAAIIPERIPFGEEEARIAANLYNRAGRRRGSLIDCMIAATALRCEAELATLNEGDFRPFRAAGLSLAT